MRLLAPALISAALVLPGCGDSDGEDGASESVPRDDPAAVAEAWASAVADDDFTTACKYVAPGQDFGKPGEFGDSREEHAKDCPARLADLVENARDLPLGDSIFPTQSGTVEEISVPGEPGYISGGPETVTLVTPSNRYVLQMEEIDGQWGVEELPVRGAAYQH